MGDLFTAVLLLAFLLASSVAGLYLQSRLKERHRSRDTIDSVRLIISMLVTFTALVLGLETSTEKAAFDEFDGRLRVFASDVTNLDQRLREYGGPSADARAKLRTYVAAAIADTWPDETRPSGAYPVFSTPADVERQPLGVMLLDVDVAIRRLAPDDAFHRQLQDLLETRMAETMRQRWLIIGTARDTVSWPLLVLMTGWLAIIFGVFGLSAPRNAVVYVTITLCALSVSSSVYLILDLDKPVNGFIKVSSTPLRDTLSHIDAPI